VGSHRQFGLTVMQILAGVGAGPSGDFQSIASFTVDATADLTVTFSSIPSTYKHLQLRAIALSNSDSVPVLLRFNSDSGSNYSWHALHGQGGAAGSGSGTSASSIITTLNANRGLNASYPWAYVIDILDYADTNKFKTVRALHGADYNGSGEVNFTSGNWRNTAAVSTITMSMASSGFNQYSSFALYGIKG
jgi:hypothetical protein